MSFTLPPRNESHETDALREKILRNVNYNKTLFCKINIKITRRNFFQFFNY